MLFFTAVVLLLGQIPLGNRTVGEHFQREVQAGLRWSGDQIRQSHWYGSLSSLPWVGGWFQSSAPAVISVAKAPPPVEVKKRTHWNRNEEEKISSEDRESLLQLLE
jgi:hypothetical protein